MNTSLEWIKAYVKDLDCTAKNYSDTMTLTGTKVENYLELDKNLDKIVVAKIISIEKHPNADKLVVCQCDIGGEVLQIVTGAKNVNVNDKVPLVIDGGKVACTHNGEALATGTEIKKGKLRGVESFGMMCSLEELGLDKNLYPDAPEDGIYILPDDAKVGEDAIKFLGLRDTIFEYEITNNRVDCFGILGIAREVAASFDKEFNKPKVSKTGNDDDINKYLNVEIKSPLCKRYCARMVKNIKLAQSPRWLKQRLISSGIRPINNIVDITNYVMLEYGQPMHAFDYNLIDGKKIIVDNAKENQIFQTLDAQERKLDSSILMINDANKALAIAGIMGGENSKITDDVDTVIFESACFEGTNIRLSSKKLGLRTESSAKFEKGLDPNNAIEAINRACQLIEELNAGDVVGNVIDIYPDKVDKKRLKLECEKINNLLGTNISKQEMLDIFKKLEFEYDSENSELIIPTFRQDLEYMADLAEEVARFYGYDKIPTTLPKGESTLGGHDFLQEIEQKARELARFCGFSQAMTYSFESPKVFDKLLIPNDSKLRAAIKILNPLGEDFSIMRTCSINGILNSLSTNYNRRNKSVKLYEIANIYLPKELPLKELPDERKIFTLAFYDAGDFFMMKGVVEEFFELVNIKERIEYSTDLDLPFLHPGRKAGIKIKGKEIGYIGQLHPQVSENYNLSEDTYIAIIDLKSIIEFCDKEIKYVGIAKYPKISRDISLVVPRDVLSRQIEDIIIKNSSDILEDYKLFDIYEGNQIKDGTKSMAYKINFRHKNRTLEDKEVSDVMNNILEDLKSINVFLRTI